MADEKPTNDDEATKKKDDAPNTDATTSEMKDVAEDVAEDDAEDKKVATKEDDDDDEKKSDSDSKEGDDEEDAPKKEKKELTEEEKEAYKNWPLFEIKEPHEHDVLYGRGGGTNHHPGNKRYRKMVEDRKLDYVNSKRLDKPLVALAIIKEWRGQLPPGRFLKLDEKTGLWLDVGDKKAREKTSQALREKAPEIRRKQEEDAMVKSGKDPAKEKEANNKKNTRFAEGTKDRQRDQMKHAVLARDHSLGREYLNPGESVALDGFSWNPATLDRIPSYGSVAVPPLPGGPPLVVYPPGRVTSHGSHGAVPPHFPPSRTASHSSSMGGGPPPSMPPPPADYYRNMSQEERQRSFGSQHVRYDSWSRLPSCGSIPPPPPMPGYGSPYQQHRSGSFGGPPGVVGGPPPPMAARDHSLSHNPLRDASIGHSASRAAFEAQQRNNSGYWDPNNMAPPPQQHGGYGGSTHPPPPPQFMAGPVLSGDFSRTPSSGGDFGRTPSTGGDFGRSPSSGGPPGNFGRTPSTGAVYDPNRPPLPGVPAPTTPSYSGPSSRSSPPYQVDPAIAKSWSTQSEDYEKAASLFVGGGGRGGGLEMKQSWSPESGNRQQLKPGTFPEHGLMGEMPRPDIAKRMTSNQNEDFDTKRDFMGEGRSIKRAALNRDNSMASNRLKAEYAPGALKRPMPLEKDMRMLSASMEQSTLGAPRPKSLATEERTNTIEKIAMELMVKPPSMSTTSRSSTIEALGLDLGTAELKAGEVNLDNLLSAKDMENAANLQRPGQAPPPHLPRPGSLRTEGRLSTAEYLDLVNEPLGLEDEERPLHLNREASVSEWLQQG